MSSNRSLNEIRNDIWRQFPSWPSTFGPCHCGGRKPARGGGICLDCAKVELADIVGQPEADAYVSMIQAIRRKEHEQDELAHEQSKQ